LTFLPESRNPTNPTWSVPRKDKANNGELRAAKKSQSHQSDLVSSKPEGPTDGTTGREVAIPPIRPGQFQGGRRRLRYRLAERSQSHQSDLVSSKDCEEEMAALYAEKSQSHQSDLVSSKDLSVTGPTKQVMLQKSQSHQSDLVSSKGLFFEELGDGGATVIEKVAIPPIRPGQFQEGMSTKAST